VSLFLYEVFVLREIRFMRQLSVTNEDLRKNLKKLMLFIIALILLILSSIVIYLFWGYYQIESSFGAREKLIVPAQVDQGRVSEIGYVCDSKIVTCIKNRTKRVYWWVIIPATKKRYLCEWQYGFSGFKKDDAVIFIHKDDGQEWPEDLSGYIIGRQDAMKEKPSSVVMHGVDKIG
jgi:hypothetical protein